MNRLHKLQYKNKQVQAKVNFFLDYFLFVNYRIGKDDLFTVETPLYIFENILIQLEENDIEKVPKYFDKYVSNSLIAHYTFSTGKENIAKFNNLVACYNNGLQEKERWLKDNKNTLIKLVEDIVKELKEGMFKEYIRGIRRFLYCNHELNEHFEDIKLAAQLIVSDFLLNGFAKEDIDEYFKRKDIYKALSNPSPKKEEFAGLLDFRFKPTKTDNFLFKLNGITLKKDEYEIVDNVFIHSCLSKKFSNLYINIDGQKQLFFGNESVDANEFGIIGVEKSYKGINHAKKQVISQINHVVKNINTFTDYRCTLDEKSFILTPDFNKYSRQSGFQIEKYNKEGFNGLRYDYGNSFAVKELREFDYLYEYARIDKDIEKYWHYIESIYKSASLFKGNSPKKIMEHTSRVLLHKHKYYQSWWLRGYILRCLIDNNGGLSLGYTYDELRTIFNHSHNFDIEEIKKRVANPFILDLITIIESSKSQDDYRELYTYYKNTLLELYEYRNHYAHTGKTFENIRIKMEKVMPMLISKFRVTICEEAERHPKKDLKTIIKSLADTAVTTFKIT